MASTDGAKILVWSGPSFPDTPPNRYWLYVESCPCTLKDAIQHARSVWCLEFPPLSETPGEIRLNCMKSRAAKGRSTTARVSIRLLTCESPDNEDSNATANMFLISQFRPPLPRKFMTQRMSIIFPFCAPFGSNYSV